MSQFSITSKCVLFTFVLVLIFRGMDALSDESSVSASDTRGHCSCLWEVPFPSVMTPVFQYMYVCITSCSCLLSGSAFCFGLICFYHGN